MKAYLHFGKGNEPRLTVSADVRETVEPRKGRTVTGYGGALPTPYMVKHNGRWFRVKVACFGNASSCYIGQRPDWIAIVDIQH